MGKNAFRQLLRKSKLTRLLVLAPFVSGSFTLIEWTDFHAKGTSLLFGINRRCVRHIGKTCLELDTAHMTWDAKVAVWLNQIAGYSLLILVVLLFGAAALGVTLFIASIIFPPSGRDTDIRSRLADSRWLWAGTMGAGLGRT